MKKFFLSFIIFVSSMYGAWTYDYEKDSLTNEYTHVFYTPAYSGTSKYGEKPLLVIRKKGDTIAAYIMAREFLKTGNFSALVKFGNGTAKSYDMLLSSDCETMFFSPDTIETVIYNIMKEDSLTVTYTPLSESSRAITFLTSGLIDLASSKNIILSNTLQNTTNTISSTDTTSSTNIYVNDLKSKTHSIGWYFWMTDSGKAYLANGRDNFKGMSIWNFTYDNKWRPIHNTSSFDGYPSAGVEFSSVKMSNDGREISFGSLTQIGSFNPGDIFITEDGLIEVNPKDDEFKSELKNKKFDIGWYFWMTDSGKAYLANGRDSSNGISIWNFTDDNKWRPIHNASAFDGYPKADKIFNNIEISSDGRNITIE